MVKGNEIYPIQIGMEDGRVREEFAYTCGHCTHVVVLNKERARPRLTCFECGRWICERGDVCTKQCTPMYRLADDHFEAPEKYKKMLPAIFAGVTSVAEAEEKKLILP